MDDFIPPRYNKKIVATFNFTAKDPDKEYIVTENFLCPTCRNHVDLEYQEVFNSSNKAIGGDRLVYQCKICGKEYEFIFYLPSDYDPVKLAKAKRRRKPITLGFPIPYNPKQRKQGQQSPDGAVLAAFMGPVELWKTGFDTYDVYVYLSPEKTFEKAIKYRLSVGDGEMNYSRAFEIFVLAGGSIFRLPEGHPMLKYFLPESSVKDMLFKNSNTLI